MPPVSPGAYRPVHGNQSMPNSDPPSTGQRTWKAIAILAILVAAGLAAAMFLRTPEPGPSNDEAIRALTERIDALESAPAPARQPGWRTGTAGNPLAVPAAAMRPASGDAAGLTPQQSALKERQLANALEAGFAKQPDDANAPRVEIEMLRAMNDRLLAGTGVVPRNPDVTCKRDACRITAQFRNDADASDWAVYYLSTVGAGHVGNSRQTLVRNPDGSVQLKLYANRAR